MAGHGRFRRLVKRTGVALLVVLLVVQVASLWWRFDYYTGLTWLFSASVGNGSVALTCITNVTPVYLRDVTLPRRMDWADTQPWRGILPAPDIKTSSIAQPPSALENFLARMAPQATPPPALRTLTMSRFIVPIWLIFVLVAIPTGVLIGGDWRRRKLVGVCPQCQYDLRGNESGTCPECGVKAVVSG